MIQSLFKACGTILMLAALTLTAGCGGGAASGGAAGSGTGATGSAK